MIFYFSATGNTKHVVDKIKRENEKLVLIENAVEKMNTTMKLKMVESEYLLLLIIGDYLALFMNFLKR